MLSDNKARVARCENDDVPSKSNAKNRRRQTQNQHEDERVNTQQDEMINRMGNSYAADDSNINQVEEGSDEKKIKHKFVTSRQTESISDLVKKLDKVEKSQTYKRLATDPKMTQRGDANHLKNTLADRAKDASKNDSETTPLQRAMLQKENNDRHLLSEYSNFDSEAKRFKKQSANEYGIAPATQRLKENSEGG